MQTQAQRHKDTQRHSHRNADSHACTYDGTHTNSPFVSSPHISFSPLSLIFFLTLSHSLSLSRSLFSSLLFSSLLSSPLLYLIFSLSHFLSHYLSSLLSLSNSLSFSFSLLLSVSPNLFLSAWFGLTGASAMLHSNSAAYRRHVDK